MFKPIEGLCRTLDDPPVWRTDGRKERRTDGIAMAYGSFRHFF